MLRALRLRLTLCLLLWLMMPLFEGIWFVIMGLMNRVAEDLAVTVPQVGYAISSYALGVVVGAPLISALAARVPRRALLIALMLVFAVGNIASAMAPGFFRRRHGVLPEALPDPWVLLRRRPKRAAGAQGSNRQRPF